MVMASTTWRFRAALSAGPGEQGAQIVDATPDRSLPHDRHEAGFQQIMLVAVEHDAGLAIDVVLQEAVSSPGAYPRVAVR